MQTVERYRRSPGIVSFWDRDQAVCFIWQSAERMPISIDALGVLHHLTDWTSAAQLRDRIAPGNDVALVSETIDLLLTLGLVEREGEPGRHPEWDEWSPAAAFFHFATKNGTFPTDLQQRERELVEKATHHPQPPPTKHIDGPRLRLPDIGCVIY